MMSLWDATWMIFGLGGGLAAVVALLARFRQPRQSPPDLGSVSQRWMAERRLEHHRDSSR